MFELTSGDGAGLGIPVGKLRGFIALAAGLVLWIAFWAFDSRTRLRASSSPQPAPLELAEHASRVGLSAEDLDLWRSAKVQTVDIDASLHAERRG